VNVARDLEITKFGDFRTVRVGEPDPKSGQPLKIAARSRSPRFQARHEILREVRRRLHRRPEAVASDDHGRYGIGISRTLQAVVEQSNDADGIVWPWNVAPGRCWWSTSTRPTPRAPGVPEACPGRRGGRGDVLIDDRAERPGVKFKDADLIGLPLRLTVGGRGLKEGIFELKWRTAKEVHKVSIAEAESAVAQAVREAAGKA